MKFSIEIIYFQLLIRRKYPTVKLFDENFDESGKESCLIKYKEWKYEKEWRLFYEKKGLVSFAPESLTGLILGCKMCEQDIKKIKKWVSKRKTPLTLKQAKMDAREYKLNIVSI